ncbi:hypothetical protein LAZ67_3005186 [Cordylochernes scorpioides]|uniref:PiggyBac transposable element-derived protein domain-containing protein n=1 Tax=Cordylochernes scorpioides TaxID=51811 RepID=A0ABY6KDI5_9ARAC|nr:hypothetical protein LAZ67_3005186 [Cordylochernes scorpioides]
MSRGRFELLYSCFSLIDDSNLVPSSHPDYNPTARFEKLIEHVNNKFIYYYKPTQNLTVDESLVCLKNRTRLRQYMPQKHHGRFGVKLWMLCESKTGYCLRMKPYKGKLSPIINEYPMNLLQESSLLGKGYHLITDNFFTSINLAKDLLDSHTYLTGTIRTNRKGLPKTLTSAKLGVDESLYMVNNNLLALAYKEKKSKPPVKFLSTFCDASSGKKKVSDQRDYPQIKICYDSYMGGVDLNDQMLYTYMDERKGRKFYRKVILNIFHRALLNSFILYEQHTKDNPKLSRRAFNYSVINELVKNHLKPPVLPSTSQEVLEKLPEKRDTGFKMDKLKKACETKRRTLESVIAEADGKLGKQEPSLEMLMSLRPKLLRCKDRFLIASDCLIEQLTKADREDEEIEDVDIVQVNIFGRSEGVLQKMEQLLAKPTVDRESIVSGGNEGKSNLHRLPKLELPKFGGEAREWLQFWSAFQSFHDDDSISACVKFQYLQNCMIKGSVSEEIVSSFPN